MRRHKRNKISDKDFIKTLPHPAFLHKADGTRLTKKELKEFLIFHRAMNRINILEKKIDEAQKMLTKHESVLSKAPDNFAYKLSLNTIMEHIADLQDQLRLGKELREKEVISLGLKGMLAREGSIP